MKDDPCCHPILAAAATAARMTDFQVPNHTRVWMTGISLPQWVDNSVPQIVPVDMVAAVHVTDIAEVPPSHPTAVAEGTLDRIVDFAAY